MSKEKQIEEMAKIFCGMKNGCDGCMWDKVHCYERNDAKDLYNAGYRKASDVAREIFEEIGKLAKHSADEAKMRADKETNVLLRAELRGQQIGGNLMLYKLAELKKKYTEEGK
jgi:hypothetical protein